MFLSVICFNQVDDGRWREYGAAMNVIAVLVFYGDTLIA